MTEVGGRVGCLWHSTGGQVILGGGGASEVWGEEENGCYDVNVRHPNSTGIKNCTSTTVLCILFYFFLPPFSPFSRYLYVKEKEEKTKQKNTGLLNIYFTNPLKNTRNGEMKLTYFSPVLFYSFFLMLIPHSLF